MEKNRLLFLTWLFSLLSLMPSFAAPGDTTHVLVHDAVDMVWYQRYRASALFPAPGTDFHRVNMRFTLGCASGGCSDWDYTVLISVLHPTGALDSNVATIDTISTNPLIVDTTWNVFAVKERFELGRMITPYGAYMRTGTFGYSNAWTHELVYDVTDYQSLLHDSVEIEIFYQGWSSGFSATLDFDMIEGTPARNVKQLRNIYPQGGFTYRNSSTVEATNLPAVNVPIDQNMIGAALHVIPSGHGFNNSLNCAEFCNREYYVRIDGQTTHTQSMWRDDCGLNPIYPQGGTWLYDRANWCPGAKAWTYEHNLTSYLTAGQTQEFDINIQPYNIGGGQDAASYNWSTVLLEFDQYAHQYDVELMEILSPSTHEDHGRLNPACGRALVRIRNKGAQPLTSCVIEYGYDNATTFTYNWTGNLGMMESEVVELGLGGPGDWQQSQASDGFSARVYAPNGMPDEYALNDEARSQFEPTPTLSGNLRLNIRTNGVGQDTWWELKDNMGGVLYTGDGYANYQLINEDITLSPGCYHLRIYDRSKNGLSFFANNDGTGYARLYEQGNSVPTRSFNADFGTRIDYWFTVGMSIGEEENMAAPAIGFMPNPAEDYIDLIWWNEVDKIDLRILDVSGREVLTTSLTGLGAARLNIETLPEGVYLLQASSADGAHLVERLLVY